MTPAQTKLLEDLRSGAVRLAPGEATPEAIGAFWRQKNTGTQELGSWGDATSDYDAYRAMLSASPDLTPALVEMIEGLAEDAASWRRVAERCKEEANAAEAERDALREALSYAHMGFNRTHTALMGNGPKQAAGEMVAHFRDAAARALTQEQNNG